MRSVRDQNPLPLDLPLVDREHNEVMGITQAEPRDAERFEEGIDSEFQDAEEVTAGETDGGETENCGPGDVHEGIDKPSDPPQVMSPNVEGN